MTEVAEYLKIAVPTVSITTKKGKQIVKEEELVLAEMLKIKI